MAWRVRCRRVDERDRPFPPDIRCRVTLLGQMTDWRPTKRHPLPSNEVLWRAYLQMQSVVRFRQAARAPGVTVLDRTPSDPTQLTLAPGGE